MRSKLHHRWFVPYLFLLPGLALYILWMIYPLGYEFYISFFDWKIMPGQHSEYVHLQNYRDVLNDKYFWLSLKNTVRYTVVTVAGQMIFGMALAVLVHRVFIGKRLFRAIYYVPVITSWVVVSFLFQFLFSSHPGGFMNYMLVSIFHILDKPVAWMSETNTAWMIIYALGIWKGIGWAMVIFLAALQGVPPELYEVAAIDGANEWKQFTNVTLPLIRRTTLFVLIALVIGGFQAFISVYLITGGKPLHRTDVVLSYMYSRAFDRLRFGYGAALSYILAAIVVLITFIQMRLFRQKEEY